MTRNKLAAKRAARKSTHAMNGGKHSTQHEPKGKTWAPKQRATKAHAAKRGAKANPDAAAVARALGR